MTMQYVMSSVSTLVSSAQLVPENPSSLSYCILSWPTGPSASLETNVLVIAADSLKPMIYINPS